jgi:hypothetical protein
MPALFLQVLGQERVLLWQEPRVPPLRVLSVRVEVLVQGPLPEPLLLVQALRPVPFLPALMCRRVPVLFLWHTKAQRPGQRLMLLTKIDVIYVS